MKRFRFAPHKPLRAQAIVEFSIAVAFFLALFLGIVEMGYFLFCYSSVFTAAREAARYGSSVGSNAAGVPHEKDCDGIRQAAIQLGGLAGLTPAGIEIRYDHGPTDTRSWANLPTCKSNPQTQLGDRIAVHASMNYRPLVGILPSLLIQNTNRRTIIKSADIEVDFPTPYPVYYTLTASPTATDTPIPAATFTPSATDTPIPAATFTTTFTATFTPIATDTPAPSSTPTLPPTPTPTRTPYD